MTAVWTSPLARVGWMVPVLLSLMVVWSVASLSIGLPQDPALRDTILFSLRVPRWLAAGLVGATLAAGGAALQALLRNPLAEPALLGVSAGAALAAVMTLALAGLVGLSVSVVVPALPLIAFAGGVGTVLIVLSLSSRDGQVQIATVLLIGMSVNLLAGAIVGLLTYLAPAQELRGMVFWAMGSFAGISWREALPALLVMGFSLLLLWPARVQLNVLSFGEEEALRMGVDTVRVKRTLVLAVALGVGAGVAIAGMIAFVGLLVPHFMRRLVGPDYRVLLPTCMLGGALLLGTADLLARHVVYPAELPVGLLTTLLGGPCFIWLVAQGRVREEIG